MLKNTRLTQIMDLIDKKGEVKTRELCRLFNVTEMTARRDLDYLSEKNLISRIHGGATLNGHSLTASRQKSDDDPVENTKYLIARKALEFIEDGQKIFVDSGSTTRMLAKVLPDNAKNTITTNNLAIGMELASRPYIDIFMVGGELRKSTFSCYGTLTEEQIRQYRVDIAFLGSSAVGADGFFYDGVAAEAGVKKSIIQAARKTFVLVDSRKFNKYDLISFSHVKNVSGVITDKDIGEDVIESLTLMGAEIIIAQ